MKHLKLSLTQWIFVGMGVGLLLGWLAPEFSVTLKPLSTIFLRMIKSIVVPLIMASLDNGMSLLNVRDFMQDIIKGSILVAAVGLDMAGRKRG